jgi:flagellar motor switch protein FliG
MSNETAQLSGTQKAAVFLMVLGEESASGVLKHLGPKEVQKLGSAMAALPNINRSELDAVVVDFSTGMSDQTPIGVGNEEYLRKVMVAALGEERAGSMIDRILVGDSSKGLEALKWMDARAVADVVRQEHPQIIAIVVSYLDSDHAADVLRHLPEDVRGDVVMRIASLESIQPGALEELDGILKRQFAGNVASKTPVVGGLRRAADIVNYMDSASEEAVFQAIGKFDAPLVERIKELMFTFDNITDLDDRGIQRLLREITSEQLILAMKGATAEIRALILKNMSKRAGESLMEDLEAKGPVRLSEVEAAQKEILATVRQLADAGEVVLGGKGGEQYV